MRQRSLAAKTELTVTEYDRPVGQMMEMSTLGMEQCLDKMTASFVRPLVACNRKNARAGRCRSWTPPTRVRRVVLLSGTSAHLKDRAGSGRGAAMMEERLDGLDVAELVYLRGCFFMESFFKMGIIAQAQTGTFVTILGPDIPTPMVATKDVGDKAVELLTEEPFRQPRVRELLGPRDYTMAKATRILGAAIGKQELNYVQVPYEEARRHMLGVGLSPSFVDAVTETARSFNEGIGWAREQRSARNTTLTTLEDFAQEVFRKAFEAETQRETAQAARPLG